METYVIDRSSFSVQTVLELLKEGKYPLCPVCKSPVLVAATPQQAKEQGIPPGMQCSKESKHFQVEFLLRQK